ncbi:MAG TPA: DUF1549 domain-containing protein, partial [Candidatus Binatia bacterium]|nr:DUF1549 domain-containing protein [Candidatus Binatia bacterium]
MPVVVLEFARVAPAAQTTINFNRDVRPILAENCFACHGPDNNARKAGLRLDTKEGIFEQTKKHEPAVAPGSLEKSELWARINAKDPDDIMPPPKSNKVLKPEQKELFKKWILAGAPWQGHWAYIKPERPAVPNVTQRGFKIRNPIDSFILAKLQSKGLKPALEADARTLARRLSLDLTGLPPKPELVEAYLSDRSAAAYQRLVKGLMDSPQWGEHRARYWLDAARYADTHGLHFDNYREMWPYRDWVIKAFSRNISFDRFILEQIAGDLLDNPDVDQLVATGFQRCNMTTNEGGTIDEENLANYANDRVTTTGWVFLGTTLNCAACHDHKFDPIKQKDFYSMEAFFRNTTQPAKDGNVRDSNPSILVPQTTEDARRWDALPAEITTAKKKVDQRRKEAKPEFETWLTDAKADEFGREIPTKGLSVHASLNEQRTNDVVALVRGEPRTIPLTNDLEWQDGKLGRALVLKANNTLDLGDAGDFEGTNGFSYGAWVRVSKAEGSGAVVSRMDVEKDFRGWDLLQNDKRFAVHIVHKWPDNAIKVSTKEDVIKEKTFQHVFVTYNGSGKAKGVKIYIDGTETPLKVDTDTLNGSIRTPVSLRVGQRSKGQEFERGRVQDLRLYEHKLAAKEVMALAKVVPVYQALTLAADQRTPEQTGNIYEYWLTTRDEPYLKLAKANAALNSEQAAIKERNPVTHIQREKANSMPMAYVLFRGQYDKPKDKVTAATPGVLHAMPASAPTNRLGLAQWLISPENPLTARVTVNRFWQEIFGVGLVKSAEDFGTTSEPPSHPELLDWLAVEFVESGWDVKHIFELIVMSSTYRQSAEVTPEKLEKDPQNRLLSRGPRFRMDAEMVR